jgi:predicted RNase H-like HicB family nuclease
MTIKRTKKQGRIKQKIPIPVIIEKSRTGYSAYSPTVDGCITTGKTIDKTFKNMREALELHLESEYFLNHKPFSFSRTLKFIYDKSQEGDAVYGVITIKI